MANVRFKSIEPAYFVQTQALVQAFSTITIVDAGGGNTGLVEGDTWSIQACSPVFGTQPTPAVTFLFTAIGATAPGQISIDISTPSVAAVAGNISSAINGVPLPGGSGGTMAALWSAAGAIGGTFVLTAGAMILGTEGNFNSIPTLVGKITNNTSDSLSGGVDSTFQRTGWFDTPTYGWELIPGSHAVTATLSSGSPGLSSGAGLLADDLTFNGPASSFASWGANGFGVPLPATYPNSSRPDFGDAGNALATTGMFLGDLKGALLFTLGQTLTSGPNPNDFDINVHFCVFEDTVAETTYGFTVTYMYAVAYFGNQDALIDNTTLVGAQYDITAGSTSYGPNGGAIVDVTPNRNQNWDTLPTYIQFSSDIFANFPNPPASGDDIGLTIWPLAGGGAGAGAGAMDRSTPVNGGLQWTGAGQNGLPNNYVLTQGDYFVISSSLTSTSGFMMSLVFAFSQTAADQVLWDAGYDGTNGARIWIPASTSTLSFAWGTATVTVPISSGQTMIATFMRANGSILITVTGLTDSNMQSATAAATSLGVNPSMTLLAANDGSLIANSVALYGGCIQSIPGVTNQQYAFNSFGPYPMSAYALSAIFTNYWMGYYIPQLTGSYAGGSAPYSGIVS